MIDILTEPPSNLPPAVAGALVDGNPLPRHVLATLIDLAKRGAVQIREHRMIGSKEIAFELNQRNPADGRAFERRWLSRIFESNPVKTLDELRTVLRVEFPEMKLDVQEIMYDNRLLDREREAQIASRKQLSGVLGLLTILWIAGGIVAADLLKNIFGDLTTPIWIAGSIILVLLTIFIRVLNSRMTAFTPRGLEQAKLWGAFKIYLENAHKYINKLSADPALFEQYLPYAVAFGVDKTWTREFTRVPSVPAPDWYIVTGGSFMDTSGDPAFSGSFSDVSGGAFDLSGGLDSLSDSLSSGLESISDSLTDMLNDAGSAFDFSDSGSSDGGWSDSGGDSWGDSGGGDSGGGDGGGGE